jgi:hypothetical protein
VRDLPPGTLTVDIPLSEEERKALETLAKTGEKGPNEIVVDAVKRFLEEKGYRGAAQAFEKKLKTLETVDVTLKIPKPLFDFLTAVVSFTKLDTTVEKTLCTITEQGIIEVMRGDNPDVIFNGFEGKQLIKAYKLDEIDC